MKLRTSVPRGISASWLMALALLASACAQGVEPASSAPAVSNRVSASDARKPNFVFVLADDLGWRDVGFAGAPFFETPHIDRLAGAGMIFERAYSSGPNCKPARACLVSGMYTPRHHIYTATIRSKGALGNMRLLVPAVEEKAKVEFPPSLGDLEPGVVSVAEVLSGAGYATGYFGKWHLGPDRQGFGVIGSDGTPGNTKKHYGDKHVADKITDAGVAFLEENRDKPFFLCVAHWDVHTPIRAKEEVVARYEEKLSTLPGAEWNPTYAAMIEAVDKSVGRLQAKIDELGLSEGTLFVFSSDNGGLPSSTDNSPLRGGKGSLFEGGIRVPTCMTWPGVIEAGSTCDVPITSVDFLPTFAELSGASLPSAQPVDGRSMVPLLEGRFDALSDRPIYWFYPLYLSGEAEGNVLPIFGTTRPYWRGVPSAAVLKDDWKLVRYFEDDSAALYNVKDDVGETDDQFDAEPARAKAMLAELNRWLAKTEAPIPTELNPDFGSPAGR